MFTVYEPGYILSALPNDHYWLAQDCISSLVEHFIAILDMSADSLSIALVITETFPLDNSQLRWHWNAPTMTDKKRWERRSIAVITIGGKCTDQQICTCKYAIDTLRHHAFLKRYQQF